MLSMLGFADPAPETAGVRSTHGNSRSSDDVIMERVQQAATTRSHPLPVSEKTNTIDPEAGEEEKEDDHAPAHVVVAETNAASDDDKAPMSAVAEGTDANDPETPEPSTTAAAPIEHAAVTIAALTRRVESLERLLLQAEYQAIDREARILTMAHVVCGDLIEQAKTGGGNAISETMVKLCKTTLELADNHMRRAKELGHTQRTTVVGWRG